MKKKLAYLCVFSMLSMFLLGGCKNKDNKDNPNYNSDNYLSGTHYALMEVENYGPVYMELYADKAPATVTNFVNLINEGFYDGLTFHRVISDFMIQGGDPNANGSGGSAYPIPGEFATNGFDNSLSHLRGTLSMARLGNDPDSASCQFFIVHQDNTGLDGYYAAFGRVVSGMEVVDTICSNVPVQDENGTVLTENQPVISFFTMIEKDQMPTVEIEVEEVKRPDPTTEISILTLPNTDGFEPVDRWVVNESGNTYLISSTEDLLSLGLYSINLADGISYGEDNILAYSSDVGAGEYIALQINITTEEYPDQLLVAEEHNGALRMYLLSFDSNNNSAYLVPFVY